MSRGIKLVLFADGNVYAVRNRSFLAMCPQRPPLMCFNILCAVAIRILNSSYHPYHVIPKPSIWPKRERLRRFIAWQYGSSRTTVRMGNQKLNKIFHYMDMQRQDQHNNEMHYSRERLEAALKEHNYEYGSFRHNLSHAHVLLDVNVLSQLAVYEPRTFKSLVDLCKKLSIDEGKCVVHEPEELDYVDTSPNLVGPAFVTGKYYQSGPTKNHTNKPRKLEESEY